MRRHKGFRLCGTSQNVENITKDYRDGAFAGTNDVLQTTGKITPTGVAAFLRNKQYIRRQAALGVLALRHTDDLAGLRVDDDASRALMSRQQDRGHL